jgi:porin
MSFRINLGVLLMLLCFGLLAAVLVSPARAAPASAQSSQESPALYDSGPGSSSNPGATNPEPGTGWLGRKIQEWLGLGKDTGIWFGGSWISDVNFLIAGGEEPGRNTVNSLVILGLRLHTEKLKGWKGGEFGIDLLQFNGSPANTQAGSVQGYNALPGPDPLNRFELYQLWWRQTLFDGKFIFQIGKSIASADFNNVVRTMPAPIKDMRSPAITSLIFTPIFTNPTMSNVLPGSYNSACGITASWLPNENIYFSYGFYDGNLARGSQTGLRGPQFNGYYLHIGEAGACWMVKDHPGKVGIGGWVQTGRLTNSGFTDNGIGGFYLYGSQRLYKIRPQIDNSGFIIFAQYGINNSETATVNQYVGGGLTGLALLPERPEDSCGIGVACSWLNRNLYQRNNEVILQGYYQMNLIGATYLQPVLSYIPAPGAATGLKSAWAVTLRFIALF